MTKRTTRPSKEEAGSFLPDGLENAQIRINKITPLNDAQSRYMKKINGSTITFGLGPAGTGKTWIAAVMAAQAFKAKKFQRIVITRPAVETGQRMGFLPGDMDEKYDPYLRPVKEAIEEALGKGPTEYFFKAEKIEARPLAFLRGSTLKDAFIIFDEAQNSTPIEMKMLLTRIGEGSKLVINGDPKQKDILGKSGLEDAVEKLRGLRDVAFCDFAWDDVVRSGIVKDILQRYERPDLNIEESREGLDRYLNN